MSATSSSSAVLTLVASRASGTLTDAMVNAARELVQGGPPVVLSPGEAADIPCAPPQPGRPSLDAIRKVFAPKAVDVLLTRARGRRKGLLIADMDSTIVTGETLDELSGFAGVKAQVVEITLRSMNGELDFQTALRERVALLKGLDLGALEETWKTVELTPGARELVATMRRHNARTALVSGGFTFFTGRVVALCGFDEHRANTLIDDGAALTGAVGEPILDRDAKLSALREMAAARGLKMAATLAVGDGANDLAMLREAGLGIAFHAKPVVAEVVANRVDHADLRALLFAQGYPTSVFAEA